MESEIICISSDDETDLQKENKKSKLDNASHTCEKVEILLNNDEKIEKNHLKRKMEENIEEETQNTAEKKKKKSTDLNTVMTLVELVFQPDLYQISSKSNHIKQPNKDQEIIIEKPELVVKEKKKISYIAHDVFPLFISLCLQKSKDIDRKDMEKIVSKLKRRYEELDTEYTSSEHFVSFINEKRTAIVNNNNKIYVYIQEVMNEMKKRIKEKPHISPPNEIYDAVPSTSYATNNLLNNEAKVDYDNDTEENVSPKTRKKIKSLLKTMAKCEERIKQLEEEEVDLDKEDSSYIKVERYKQRMVELYNKYCELTGENPDAGRSYLRPKHISATRIVAVDQAITNFVNSKITRRNQIKGTGTLTDDVIFPDYRDILECVNRCNERKNLGLDTKKQKQLAKKAFLELGELLQRTRRNDYWDTFSLYLENTREDPAIKDKDLAQKLIDNRTEGEKRLAAIFEKYTKKQEEIKEQNNVEITSVEEEEEEEEESIMLDDENKSKDDLSIASLSEEDSDNEETIKKKVKDNRPLVENDISNISKTNIYRNTNQVIANKGILDTSKQKFIENNKIKTTIKEVNLLVPKKKNQTTSEKIIRQVCNNNIVAQNIVNSGTPKVLSACSTADCTNNINRTEEDLPEMIAENMSKVTEPVRKTIIKDTADVMRKVAAEPIIEDVTEVVNGDVAEVITEDVTEVITDDVAEVITEDVTEVVVTRDVAEVITEDVTEVIAEDVTEDVIVTENRQEEEKKPLLRVRSFAKPPTTWEVDGRQKTVKTIQENASKETNQHKEVVDLTNETTITNKTSSITKRCTIQLGDKVLPVVKSQRLFIPKKKNIISVQNITNNYLKVKTGQIIAPVRDISASTIIRLPSAQTITTKQNQSQNSVTVRNEVPFRGNETILRIIQSKPNNIVISKKSVSQSISKQINAHLPKTK